MASGSAGAGGARTRGRQGGRHAAGEGGGATRGREAASDAARLVNISARREIMDVLKSVILCLWNKTRVDQTASFRSPSCARTRPLETVYHGQRQRSEHQE